MFYSTYYLSPVGRLKLASDGRSLVGLWIEGQKYFGNTVQKEMMEEGSLDLFDSAVEWLDRYFSGERPAPDELPLAPAGGDFRQAIWEILCQIPYGEVITYGEIARQMALKMHRSHMSAQAVGGAIGHNPISIIIPCHRVVGASGSPTGYAGGIEKKMWLLMHEGADTKRFFLPQRGV